MSGTGKSSVARALAARGYKAIDTDDGWSQPLPDGRQRWREDAIAELLATEDTDVPFVAGCEENKVRFHPQFDHIVLLSAPPETLMERLASRASNPFGKDPVELSRVLDGLQTVEPLLREASDHEVGATIPLDDVVTTILQLVGGYGGQASRKAATVQIVVDDLSGPQIAQFLDEHVQEMRSITPSPDSKHALDLDDLRRPEITFWSVLDGAARVGCGAVKRLDASHAEVKSMRTAPARRRDGIASVLLGHIITEATRMGFARLSLETGSYGYFLPARKLYEKFGFDYCGPFADYQADPNSVFMTRRL
jgi:putative acetyltransferase